jgi:hypothetical protein
MSINKKLTEVQQLSDEVKSLRELLEKMFHKKTKHKHSPNCNCDYCSGAIYSSTYYDKK